MTTDKVIIIYLKTLNINCLVAVILDTSLGSDNQNALNSPIKEIPEFPAP